MEKNYEGGVWRTIKGRRVFIRDGEDLGSAMKRSGKFDNLNNKPRIISKEEYDKKPKDYKGILKELVDTAKFRGENPDELRKMYEKMGYDVDKDKTILELGEDGGTRLSPVKIKEDNKYEVDVSKRVKENKIVDSFGNNVVYQNKTGNWVTSRENYNDYVTGKAERLGGTLALNEKDARETLASYDALEKYPSKGYVADMKSGNDVKYKEQKQANLDKMYKTIGYDDSKYNYGFKKEDYSKVNEKSTYETLKEHILSHYTKDYGYDAESPEKALIDQVNYMKYGNRTNEQIGKEIATGGGYLVYNQDMREFLDKAGISYKKDGEFDKYTEAIGVATAQIINEYNEKQSQLQLARVKQLASDIRETQRMHTSAKLEAMSLGKLRSLASEYNIDTKGLNKDQLLARIIAIFK